MLTVFSALPAQVTSSSEGKIPYRDKKFSTKWQKMGESGEKWDFLL